MGSKKRRVEESESEEGDIEEEDDGDDEEGEDKDTEPGPSGRTRQAIYNIDALHEKLEDISWTSEVHWDETLAVTSEQPTAVGNVEDDLARELAFYNQALDSAKHAIRRFEEAGVPWMRPLDYYAEMVKSDEHMAKVKEQLMFEQRQIEQAEERRKQRESKMYGKEVQAAKQKERNADKKRNITEISKLRKQREKSGFEGELDMDEQLAEMEQRRPMNIKQLGQRGSQDPKAQNRKRQSRDSKFGFGGRKALKKQNDAYSAANMDDYKPGGFKERFGPRKGGVQKRQGDGGGGGGGGSGGSGGSGGKKGPKKGGKQQRPGKQRRQSMKGGKGGR